MQSRQRGFSPVPDALLSSSFLITTPARTIRTAVRRIDFGQLVCATSFSWRGRPRHQRRHHQPREGQGRARERSRCAELPAGTGGEAQLHHAQRHRGAPRAEAIALVGGATVEERPMKDCFIDRDYRVAPAEREGWSTFLAMPAPCRPAIRHGVPRTALFDVSRRLRCRVKRPAAPNGYGSRPLWDQQPEDVAGSSRGIWFPRPAGS
jgi:hypothetical protein